MRLRGVHPAIRGEVEVEVPDDSDLARAMRAGTLQGLSLDLRGIAVEPAEES